METNVLKNTEHLQERNGDADAGYRRSGNRRHSGLGAVAGKDSGSVPRAWAGQNAACNDESGKRLVKIGVTSSSDLKELELGQTASEPGDMIELPRDYGRAIRFSSVGQLIEL